MGIYILVCRGEIGYPTVRVDVGAKPTVGTKGLVTVPEDWR